MNYFCDGNLALPFASITYIDRQGNGELLVWTSSTMGAPSIVLHGDRAITLTTAYFAWLDAQEEREGKRDTFLQIIANAISHMDDTVHDIRQNMPA